MLLAYGILIEATFLNSSFDLSKLYFIKRHAQEVLHPITFYVFFAPSVVI